MVSNPYFTTNYLELTQTLKKENNYQFDHFTYDLISSICHDQESNLKFFGAFSEFFLL